MASHGQRGDEKSGLCTMDESSILRRRGLQVGEPDAADSVYVCACMYLRVRFKWCRHFAAVHRRRSPDSCIRTWKGSAVGGRRAAVLLSLSWDSVLRAHPSAEK